MTKAQRILKKSIKKKQKTMKITQTQTDIIYGSLLGDGNLQTSSKGKTWRYRAVHSIEQADYIKYKYNNLAELCGTGLISREFQDKRLKTSTKRLYFNTLVQPCLTPFGNMFYKYDEKTNKFVKDVPENVQEYLTPLALAVFYQDDGAIKVKNSKGLRICTESFSKEGVERIITALDKKYGIQANLAPVYKKSVKVSDDLNISKEIRGYRIYIPAASAQKFNDLIREFVIDSMKYKLTC